MRIIVIFLILFTAASTRSLPHLAMVTGVASNDALNVRIQPSYKSQKVGTLPPDARVKVVQCKQVGQSRWCRVSGLNQSVKAGWVNAKFLLFDRKYSKISTRKLSLMYPSDVKAQKNRDGSIRLYKSIALKHYSGSDERDSSPLLYKRVVFSMKVAVYPTLRKALKATFKSYSDRELAKEMHYDAKTDSFRSPAKGDWVEKVRYHGRNAHRIMIGAEGVGVEYYYYKQKGRVVVLSKNYDRNPPLDPKSRMPMRGKWSLGNESAMVGKILRSLRISSY